MLKHYSVCLALAIVVYGWNNQFESAHKQMGWQPPTRIRYLHRCRPRRTAASIPTSTTIITDDFQMAFDETRNLSDYSKGSFTFSIEPQKNVHRRNRACGAEAEAQRQQKTVNQSTELTVYITNTGSKYHRSDCRYLRQSSHPISLLSAKSPGYEPCKVCDSPR